MKMYLLVGLVLLPALLFADSRTTIIEQGFNDPIIIREYGVRREREIDYVVPIPRNTLFDPPSQAERYRSITEGPRAPKKLGPYPQYWNLDN